MAACLVKQLSFIIFIHVLRETTAPPRNDAKMETQHSFTNNITRENSTDPSYITQENLSGLDIVSMKNFTDPSGLTRENFSGPNNILSPNSTDPNDLAMEKFTDLNSTAMQNCFDLNSTAMPNSTYSNNITMNNFIDLNNITLPNSTVPKNISMENSIDANYITIEYSTGPKVSMTGNSSDPNDITMSNYTNSNDTMNNSITLNDTTMGNSIDSNAVVKANSISTITLTCMRQYGITPSNLTTDIELLERRFIKGYLNCLSYEWQKLFFSELHNSTQRWNQSHDSINIGDLKHVKAAASIWMYGSPILIAVGTIGNILSFAVMLRKKIRQSTTSLYLSVLAIVDTAVLYTGLLNTELITIGLGYNTFGFSQFACKFVFFILYTLQQFDSWVLVNVALERVCAVFLPHKVKEIFTKKFATVSLIIQALVIIAINNHFFYTRVLVVCPGRDGKCLSHCEVVDTYIAFVLNIYPWIDLCLLLLIPFTIIISSNVAIVYRLLCSRYKKTRLHVNSQAKMTSMTAILITVSIVFLVTTAPFRIYLIKLLDRYQDADMYQKATLTLVFVILNMIKYINYSVNFFLYCVSGPHFRKELKVMFSRKKRVNPIETTSASNRGHTSTTR